MKETQVQSLGWEDPWRRNWQATPVFLPGKFHGQRSLAGYSPWGIKSRTWLSNWTHTHTHTHTTPWSQWWWFTRLESPSAATWSLWRRLVLSWPEVWRKRTSNCKHGFRCLLRLWEQLQGYKEDLEKVVLRLGIISRQGCTSNIDLHILRLSNRSLLSSLSQESRLKSPLQMLKPF